MALWFRRIQRVQVPEDRRGFVACWIGGAALGALALALGAGWFGGSLAVLAAVAGSQRRSDPEYVLAAIEQHIGSHRDRSSAS